MRNIRGDTKKCVATSPPHAAQSPVWMDGEGTTLETSITVTVWYANRPVLPHRFMINTAHVIRIQSRSQVLSFPGDQEMTEPGDEVDLIWQHKQLTWRRQSSSTTSSRRCSDPAPSHHKRLRGEWSWVVPRETRIRKEPRPFGSRPGHWGRWRTRSDERTGTGKWGRPSWPGRWQMPQKGQTTKHRRSDVSTAPAKKLATTRLCSWCICKWLLSWPCPARRWVWTCSPEPWRRKTLWWFLRPWCNRMRPKEESSLHLCWSQWWRELCELFPV